jgi:hypothetical protein
VLSALVPQTEPLRDLTAARLAALNHGTITSPIPGQEVPLVLSKVKSWASNVGEIRVGEEPSNPIIGLELLDVDTDSILGQARHVDTTGSRRTKVRKLSARAAAQLEVAHQAHPWVREGETALVASADPDVDGRWWTFAG